MYLKAGFLEVFGDGVAASRMFSVVLSLASLAVFYLLARRRLALLPSLLVLLLLSTSLWFLHFSRTPWVAMSAVLAALLTAYVLDLALERGRPWLFALVGLTTALGAYGYFAGITLVPTVMACSRVALLLKALDARTLILGFALSGVVAFVVFAPQLKTQLENWEYAATRPRSVSVFSVEGEYLGHERKSEILLNQAIRTARGFVLLDKTVVNYGLWSRHRPVNWAFVDQVTGVVYWMGLAAGLVYWRRYLYWWVFLLVPLFFTQVFSTGTPDGSRALIVAPFMFLFVGLGIQTLLSLAKSAPWQRALPVAAIVAAVLVAGFNVDRYFSWIQQPATLAARAPSVDVDEFSHWRELARATAAEGRLLPFEEWLRFRESVVERDGAP